MISRIIDVDVRAISRATGEALTETLIIMHLTKTKSNNCFIIHFMRKRTKISMTSRARDSVFFLEAIGKYVQC